MGLISPPYSAPLLLSYLSSERVNVCVCVCVCVCVRARARAYVCMHTYTHALSLASLTLLSGRPVGLGNIEHKKLNKKLNTPVHSGTFAEL